MLSRETCQQPNFGEKKKIEELRQEKKIQMKKEVERENYHDEDFMDKLIAKMKRRDLRKKKTESQLTTERKCVDFRYLND